MHKDYKLGAHPSPSDPRDYRIARIAKVTVEHEQEYETEWLPPVYNQGMIGSCVAFALRTLREIQQYMEHGEYKPLSSGFIYANRAPEHHQGEGMYTSQALYQMRRYGVCREFMFNMNAWYVAIKDMLTDRMFENAKPRIIEAYARAYTNAERMSAIKELGGLMLTVPVHKHFYNAKETVEQADTEIDGYHAMVIYGWKYINGKLYWKVRNSWGENWGNGGNILMAEDYAPSPEMWAVTDAIDSSVERTDYYVSAKMGDEFIINEKTGEKIEIDLPIQMINNRTVLPLRAIANAVGTEVHWDNRLKTAYVLIKE